MKTKKERYTVRVRSYKGGRMFEIKDDYWDSRCMAFTKPDGAFYSTERLAASIVGGVPGFLQEAKPGKVYQLETGDYPFGVPDSFVEVPANWFH